MPKGALKLRDIDVPNYADAAWVLGEIQRLADSGAGMLAYPGILALLHSYQKASEGIDGGVVTR
jgi:hypothetical protein